MFVCRNDTGTWRAFSHQSEAARFLGVSARSVTRWIEKGEIGVKAANRGLEFYQYGGILLQTSRGAEGYYTSDSALVKDVCPNRRPEQVMSCLMKGHQRMGHEVGIQRQWEWLDLESGLSQCYLELREEPLPAYTIIWDWGSGDGYAWTPVMEPWAAQEIAGLSKAGFYAAVKRTSNLEEAAPRSGILEIFEGLRDLDWPELPLGDKVPSRPDQED